MDAGVSIFFLISGFLLYMPFVASAFDDREPMGPRRFFRHRFLRIFPAYWVAFICITLFIGIDMPIPGRRSIFDYFFLLQLYDPADAGRRALGGISQSWTLVVEISFYLFIPLYAYVMRRIGGRRGLRDRFRLEVVGLSRWSRSARCGASLVYWGFPTARCCTSSGSTGFPRTWTCSRWAWGWPWSARGSIDATVRCTFFDVIGRHDVLWWLVALVPFQIVSMHIGLSATLEQLDGPQSYLRQWLYGATALFLLLPAVFGPQRPRRDPTLPAGRADRLSRHHLLRHLPVAPGLPEKGAPVGWLGTRTGRVRARGLPRRLPRPRVRRARPERRRRDTQLVPRRTTVAAPQGPTAVQDPSPCTRHHEPLSRRSATTRRNSRTEARRSRVRP